jgi:site-specific recombinase XerD
MRVFNQRLKLAKTDIINFRDLSTDLKRKDLDYKSTKKGLSSSTQAFNYLIKKTLF